MRKHVRKHRSQRHPSVAIAAQSSSTLWFSMFVGLGLATLVVLLYLIKSALGINVMPGHMPLLHAALYPIVRG